MPIKITHISKSFGEQQVLRDVTLDIPEGQVVGLLGPNGAGKSTLMKILIGLWSPDNGSVQVPARIGYLPENNPLYEEMYVAEYLEFMASFFADGQDRKVMVERGMSIAKLGERIDSKVDSYSKGMKRRLLIARAIMFRPKLAILDEVTSGLDVSNAFEVRDIIRQVAREGTSVIISSHNMFEVELLCERVAMINHGSIVLEGTPQELKDRYGADNLEEVFMKAVSI